MVEVCNDILVKDLNELKSKTCNTMWSKLNGCTDCKFYTKFINGDNKELYFTSCLLTILVETIKTEDKRKIKGVY